jgi:hypothetical protein
LRKTNRKPLLEALEKMKEGIRALNSTENTSKYEQEFFLIC